MTSGSKRPTVRLIPTDEYTEAKNALDPNLQRFVGWAEESIAEDPDHTKWRRKLRDGSIVDYMLAGEGLMIRYLVLTTDSVRLVELINQRDRDKVWAKPIE